MAIQQSQFFHHPDGYITIKSDDTEIGELQVTLDEFLTFEPAYALPAGGYTAQEYLPNKRHTLWKGSNQFGGAFPDATLQGYIDNVADYIEEHNNPPRTVEQAIAQKVAALNTLNGAKKNGYVLLFAGPKTMPSQMLNANQIIQYQIDEETPEGFYLKAVNGEKIELTLAQLLEYNAGVVQLHLLCNQNRDAIEDAINALVDPTVEEIDDFNIATNPTYPWPTVPYTPT